MKVMYRCDEKIERALLKELKIRQLRREQLYLILARKIALTRSVYDKHLKSLATNRRIEKGPNKNDPYRITEKGLRFLDAVNEQ